MSWPRLKGQKVSFQGLGLRGLGAIALPKPQKYLRRIIAFWARLLVADLGDYFTYFSGPGS